MEQFEAELKYQKRNYIKVLKHLSGGAAPETRRDIKRIEIKQDELIGMVQSLNARDLTTKEQIREMKALEVACYNLLGLIDSFNICHDEENLASSLILENLALLYHSISRTCLALLNNEFEEYKYFYIKTW